MLNQRGFSPILLVFIVILGCGLALGGFYILRPQPQVTQSSQSQLNSSVPSSLPLPSVAPVSPSQASPSAVLTPAGDIVHVNLGLHNVDVKVGTTLMLDYKLPGYDWTDDFDSSFIQSISPNQVKVIKVGTTVLKSEGRPHCLPGDICPNHILEFSATLVAS